MTNPTGSPSANLITKHIPDIPQSIQHQTSLYQNIRSAYVVDWFKEGLLIETRFADTSQLHYVTQPMGMREQITFNTEPFGSGIVPHTNADGLLFTRDVGGAENYQIFWLDWQTRTSTLKSDGKSRYTGIEVSPGGNRFSYSSTEGNGTDWDLFIQHLDGGKEVLQEQAGVGWSIADWHPDETKVLAIKYVSPIESYLYEFDLQRKSRSPLLDDLGQVSIGSPFYGEEKNIIYFVSDSGIENRHLFRLDTQQNDVRDLMPDLKWDVEHTQLSTDRQRLAYSINEEGFSKLYVVTLKDFSDVPLPILPEGRISNLRFSADGSQLALSIGTATSPTDTYVIDLEATTITRWTRSEIGEVNRDTWVAPTQFTYSSFDERDIRAFIYEPQASGPHPVLIYIHGGPASQYRPGFSSLFQFLQSELDIAIVAPNVRGSSGYGKTYLGLDDGYLREDSVKDIGALLDWVEANPKLDETRVAVYGGSYGGYMVLASMVHFADRLRCGIETVGISNFVTFLEKTQGYRRDLRRVEYGDERDPKMRTFLESIAPINHVASMSKPMLIGQGLNDPRVPAHESEQIVAELEDHNIPVWYMLATDEGHGFRKKRNRDYFNQVLTLFLQTHLL